MPRTRPEAGFTAKPPPLLHLLVQQNAGAPVQGKPVYAPPAAADARATVSATITLVSAKRPLAYQNVPPPPIAGGV